jgi:hypothetical protein
MEGRKALSPPGQRLKAINSHLWRQIILIHSFYETDKRLEKYYEIMIEMDCV